MTKPAIYVSLKISGYMSLIPALGRLRQEYHEFKASLG
jgi:hypothetical protein